MEPAQSPEEIGKYIATLFDTSSFDFTVDSSTETLFVQISGLDKFTPDEIEARVGPYLEELDSDFEQIILLNL